MPPFGVPGFAAAIMNDARTRKTLVANLAAISAVTVTPTGAAITTFKMTGDSAISLQLAAVVAILGLLVTTVALSQETLRVLIHHAPEIMRTRHEGYAMKRVTNAAVCGPHAKAADAVRKRADARRYAAERGWSNPTTLGDMIQINRGRTPAPSRARGGTAKKATVTDLDQKRRTGEGPG
jgi:1,6-anhydro-N-acetylmuramate kinase